MAAVNARAARSVKTQLSTGRGNEEKTEEKGINNASQSEQEGQEKELFPRPLGLYQWKDDNKIQPGDNCSNKVARQSDIFSNVPFHRPVTRSGFFGTVIVILGAAAYEAMGYHECRNASITCQCWTGCSLISYGKKTRSYNPPLTLMQSHETLDNVTVCETSHTEPEAVIFSTRSSRQWSLTASGKSIPLSNFTSMEELKNTAAQSIGFLPPSTKENVLRYINVLCASMNVNQLRNCSVFYNELTIPPGKDGTPVLESKELRAVGSGVLSRCLDLPSECVFDDIVELGAGIAVLRVEDSMILLDLRYEQKTRNSKEHSLDHHSWWTFDPDHNAMIQFWRKREWSGIDYLIVKSYTFSRTDGWYTNTQWIRMPIRCAQVLHPYLTKVGVLADQVYLICYNPVHPCEGCGTTFQLELFVLSMTGNTLYQAQLGLESYPPPPRGRGVKHNGPLEVRHGKQNSSNVFIFYPYSDIISHGKHSCFCFVVPGNGAPPKTLEVPWCIAKEDRTFSPYFLPNLKSFVYGPAIISEDGDIISSADFGQLRSHSCDQSRAVCSPHLPVDFAHSSRDKIGLATLQTRPEQNSEGSASDVVHFSVNNISQPFSSESSLETLCSGQPIATLGTFEEYKFQANTSYSVSGFLQEEYALGKDVPKNKFQPVSYVGPTVEVDYPTADYRHYINMYPSLKVVYRDTRVFAWSVIPANVHGVYRPLYVIIGFFLPVVFAIFCKRCLKRSTKKEQWDLDSFHTITSDQENIWGESTAKSGMQKTVVRDKLESEDEIKENESALNKPLMSEDQRKRDSIDTIPIGREVEGEKLRTGSGTRKVLGRDVWHSEDVIQENESTLFKIASKVDLFNQKPPRRPVTWSGLAATILLLITVGLYTFYQAWLYKQESQFSTKIEVMERGTCSATEVLCNCNLGCAYKPFGSYTSSHYSNLGFLYPNETTQDLKLCSGSSVDGEALAIIGASSLSWQLYLPSGYGSFAALPSNVVGYKDQFAKHPWSFNVTSSIIPLSPSATGPQLEYLSFACNFSDPQHFSIRKCILLFNNLNVPGFGEMPSEQSKKANGRALIRFTESPSVGKSDEHEAPEGLFRCLKHNNNPSCTFTAFKLEAKTMLKYCFKPGYFDDPYQCVHCMLSMTLPDDFDYDRDCLHVPDTISAFDAKSEVVVTVPSYEYEKATLEPVTYRYHNTGGWEKTPHRNVSFPNCHRTRISIFRGNLFYFCVGKEKKNVTLITVDAGGNQAAQDLGIKPFCGDVEDFLSTPRSPTVVSGDGVKVSFMLFYPFADFDLTENPQTSCYVFFFQSVHDRPFRRNIPYCLGSVSWYKVRRRRFRKTYNYLHSDQELSPYFLGHSKVYIFGSTIVTMSGNMYHLTDKSLYRNLTTTHWTSDGLKSAPLLPVDYRSNSMNRLTVATMKADFYQPPLESGNHINYFVFEMEFRSDGFKIHLPCFDDTVATLRGFEGQATLRGDERSALSGFLQEYYLFNRSDHFPKLLYQPVSYSGPAPNVSRNFSSLSLGQYGLVNLYPSVKATYKEKQVVSLSSIPGNVYNAFQVAFGALWFFSPALYYILAACCYRQSFLRTENTEESSTPGEKDSNYPEYRNSLGGANEGPYVLPSHHLEHEEASSSNAMELARTYWREKDKVNGRYSYWASKIDFFRVQPLNRPPTRSGLLASALLIVVTTLYATYEILQYERESQLSTRIGTIAPAVCRSTLITCTHSMGCRYLPFGPLTTARNPTEINLPMHQSEEVTICPGDSNYGEAMMLAGRTLQYLSVYSADFSGYPKPKIINTDRRMKNEAPELMLPIYSSAPNSSFEYVSMRCADSTNVADCVLLYNEMEIPHFMQHVEDVTSDPRSTILSSFNEDCMHQCLPPNPSKPSPCQFRNAFRLRDDTIVLHFFIDEYCYYVVVGSRSGEMSSGCHRVPQGWGCQVVFDNDLDLFVQYPELDESSSNITTVAFRCSRSNGWTHVQSRSHVLTHTCYHGRLAVLNNNFFFFCFSGDIDTLQTFDHAGKRSVHKLCDDYDTYKVGTVSQVSARWNDSTKTGIFIFYPYRDFAGQDSVEPCYYLYLANVHANPDIHQVNYCTVNNPTDPNPNPGKAGIINAYSLQNGGVFLFGPVVVRQNGQMIDPREHASIANRTMVPSSDFSTPFVPVDVTSRADTSRATIVALTSNQQRVLTDNAFRNQVEFFEYQLVFETNGVVAFRLPSEHELVRLEDFGSKALWANTSNAVSGLLQEYHFMNLTGKGPQISFKPVPYSGAINTSVELWKLSVGQISYVNEYPSIKAVYKEHRVLSASSIPANVHGTFRLAFLLLGFLTPAIYYVVKPCSSPCCRGFQSSKDKGEHFESIAGENEIKRQVEITGQRNTEPLLSDYSRIN